MSSISSTRLLRTVIGRTGKGNYGHGLDVVWKQLDNVEVVAVADEDEKGRAAAATRLGARAWHPHRSQAMIPELGHFAL